MNMNYFKIQVLFRKIIACVFDARHSIFLKRARAVFLLIWCVQLLVSCKKEQSSNQTSQNNFQRGEGVFVLNEGNFNWGNASVDFIHFESGLVSRNIFTSINGFPLGDVLQSAYLDQSRLYLVVNNSGRIREVNLPDFKYIHSSSQLVSPRYMIMHGDRILVSDLYANCLHVLRRADLSLQLSIPLSGWVEQMVKVGDELILANVRRHKLYFMNLDNLTIVDSLQVPDAPMYLKIDCNDKLWVLCYGELFPATQGGLTQVDIATRMVIKSFNFPLGEHPTRLCMNPTQDTLYFLNRHVFRMAIYDQALPAQAYINGDGKNYYALGIDKTNGEIWIGDARDYVQPGRIMRYSASGHFIAEYVCGIIPGDFVFW